MSRLPTPGSDAGTWGTILNDFLNVAHNGDGSLKDGSVGDATITSVSQSKVINLVSDLAGKAAVGHTHTLTFSLTAYTKQGTLSTGTGTFRLPTDGTYTVVGTRLMVGTAPTGANLIIDVNKNGTTIYTTQANRPSITAGSNSGGPGSTPDVTSLAAGDYLTIDIDQVGSTVAGADLTVTIVVSKTVA